MSNRNANVISTWTSGAGIAIGTNIDISAIVLDATATTVTIVHEPTIGTPVTLLTISGFPYAVAHAIATKGPVTGTSSGGSFAVVYVNRN